MSSRLAWIAVFTLAVRLATSSLYFASSLSSSVTLAFTMAILSFIRGTWSFMSRIFCWRISSGSSDAEMKKPMKDRTTLVNRCHINSSSSGTLRWLRWGRRFVHIARRNWIFGDKIADRVGDLLFFLLFLQPPTGKAFFFPRYLFIIALDLRSLLGYILINLRLDLTVLFILACFQFFGSALLHPLVAVQRAIAPNRIVDDLLNVHARRVERHQNRRLLYVRRQIAKVLALQHVGDLEDRIALRGGRDFRRLVDLLERSGIRDRSSKFRLRGYAGRDVSHALRRAPGSGRSVSCARRDIQRVLLGTGRIVDGNDVVVPLLGHLASCLINPAAQNQRQTR